MKNPRRFTNWKIFILLTWSIAFANGSVQAGSSDTIKIDQIRTFIKLVKFANWYLDDTHSINTGQLPDLVFKDTIPVPLKIFTNLIQKDVYLKFVVTNRADSSIRFYFSPGIYFSEIQIYRLETPEDKIEPVTQFPGETTGFKKLELGPHQTGIFVARLRFVKTNAHNFMPVLIRDYFLSSYISMYRNAEKDSNIVTFLFSGILLMMIFYSIAAFSLNRSREFVYYAGFAFCLGLMFFLKSYLYRVNSSFNNFFEAYLDFMMQSIGTFIYLVFLRKFIDTKRNFPWLHKMLLIEQATIIASILLFSFLFFGTDNYVWQNKVETLTKYVWSLGTVIFIIYAIRKKNKLLNYLAIGHGFLLIGGLISLYLISSPTGFRDYLPPLLNNALVYYELGLAAELMFFLAALAFKNRADIIDRTKERERLKLRTEMQDFEKQLAVLSAQQDERNRISADMHDELGSGVTAIRLMSEIVKAKMKDNVLPEINRISNAANELIIKMNALIWTMKSENDSIESLLTYIRIYSLEFFDNTDVECLVNIPPTFPKNIEVSGEKRRNIFLTVKESLNNILKHSKASKVIITIEVDKKLTIMIADNGIGIDFDKLRQFGSGLNNIKKRIEGMEGIYKIENNAEGGAKTTLELNL